MEKFPKVSIVIPTYNRADYICETIESALAQSYPNKEIVVSDNCSTDNTAAVIAEYIENGQIRYFKNEKNLGMTANFRKSIYEYATGDFAVLLSDDDFFIDSDFIQKGMDIVRKNSDVALVIADIKILYEPEGELLNDVSNRSLLQLSSADGVIDGNTFFLNFHRGYNLPLLAILFDRRLYLQNDFFAVDFPSVDFEASLCIMINKKIGYLPRAVSVWRRHQNNESKMKEVSQYLANAQYIERTYQHVKKTGPFNHQAMAGWRQKMLIRFYTGNIIRLSFMSKDLLKQFLREIKKIDSNLYWRLTFDLKLIIFRLLSHSYSLTYFLFKHLLKREDLIRDYKR